MVVGMMMGWGSVADQQEWRKGPWTPEEDKLLTEYVKLHGEGRWSSVARSAGLKRSGKSCRLRWVNYLRPGLRRGHLTPQEEGIIIELHALWGNKWSTIARYLPGRTDNEIKNYWRTHFKKKPKVSDRKAKRSSLCSSNNSTKQDEENNNTVGSTDQLINQSDDHTSQISSDQHGHLQPLAMTYSAQYPNIEMISPAGLPAHHAGGQFYTSEAAVAASEAWLTDTVPVDGLWGWLWNFDDEQIGGVNHGMIKSKYADIVNQNGGLVRSGSRSFGFGMHQNGAYIS